LSGESKECGELFHRYDKIFAELEIPHRRSLTKLTDAIQTLFAFSILADHRNVRQKNKLIKPQQPLKRAKVP
jgi:hypothetical protein